MIWPRHCFIGAIILLSMILGDWGFAVAADSITDRRLQWPRGEQWVRLLRLEDYNTRVVVCGATLLGLAAGIVGSFTLLRRRALMGDALSHATLPGIGLAFMILTAAGYEGKSLGWLLLGGTLTGVMGVLTILLIRRATRLKEDAAMGIVLSVFFGGGVALLGVIQQMPAGHAAGLEGFIYGKTASMVAADAWWIGVAGLGSALLAVLFFKELKLICFDEGYAHARGFPVPLLDLLLMTLVTLVTMIGLQAVGLILMIALLVIPAAAARFWTERMTTMTVLSGFLGACSCLLGAGLSAIFSRLPSGAMIVLVAAMVFLISMLLGRARGVIVRRWRRVALNRKIDRQHLLRGCYEYLETMKFLDAKERGVAARVVPWDSLLSMRSWTLGRLRRCVRRAIDEGLVERDWSAGVRLTDEGLVEARRMVHEHRLWEIYLITHADVAPAKVDRDADAIEHILDAEMIAQLEAILQSRVDQSAVAVSPHQVQVPGSMRPTSRTGVPK